MKSILLEFYDDFANHEAVTPQRCVRVIFGPIRVTLRFNHFAVIEFCRKFLGQSPASMTAEMAYFSCNPLKVGDIGYARIDDSCENMELSVPVEEDEPENPGK